MAPSPIKVGIIGYGFSTKCFHLPFILPNPDLELYAFLQRAPPPKTDEEAKKLNWGHCTVDFPKVKHYTSKEGFFADKEIELVCVLTSDGTHFGFAEAALAAGKNVVVEKPFLNSSAEADKLIELGKKSGKVLTVFQNRRYDSGMRTLSKLKNDNILGDIKEAEIHYDFPDPSWVHNWTSPTPIPGQGMIFGLGSHSLDQALALFGRPASVTAFLRSNRGSPSPIDDTFTIILQYDGEQKDLLVTVKTAIVTHMKDQLLYFVRGTKGSYLKFGTDAQENKAIANPGVAATDPKYGVEDESTWGTLTTTTEVPGAKQAYDEASKHFIGKYPSIPGSYRKYYADVVAAIRGEGEVQIKPETARDGLRIMELARESHDTKKTVVWS